MFDKFCSLHERLMEGKLHTNRKLSNAEMDYLIEARKAMSTCALFDFGTGLTQPKLSDEEVEALREGWFLPFEVIAMEDDQGCIILRPMDTGARGLKNMYCAVEYRYVFDKGMRVEMMRNGIIGKMDYTDKARKVYPELPGSDASSDNSNWCMAVGMNMPQIIVTNGKPQYDPTPMHEQMQDFHRNVSIAIFEVAEINRPNKWVVKKETIKARPIQKGKIPRSDQRPRYVLVTDEELSRVLREPNPENSPIDRRPHRRRRHLRFLQSERYSEEKRFKHTVVEACWVGPQQAEYSGERYTVCLDL